ncbi:hypothetical protein HYDPIDRAFT_108013 [Hydnomerulius pinastri MD-312]|nr:hypothetical protein HYDPIDRAFT_108013 [Hydnomerulius pinastri MD-312]
MHFLGSTLQEEASVPLRMHVMYAFPGGKLILQIFRMIGTGTSDMNQVGGLVASSMLGMSGWGWRPSLKRKSHGGV